MYFQTIASRYVRNYPLTFRLLVYILLCSSLVTLLATVFQIAVDFRKDISFIRTRLLELEMSHAQTLGLSVWNFDTDQIDTIMDGMLMLPDIEYVEVRTGISVHSAGDKPEKYFISHEFPLPEKDGEALGSVWVAAGLGQVFKRMKERVLIILGSQAVKTFVVSFFILFILRNLVTRHLNTMAEFARRLDLKKLDRFLILDRKERTHKDELDRVTQAINQMIRNLSTTATEMETRARIQGELDAAAVIQQACTLQTLPALETYDLAARFRPAREMSGDYYDIIRVNDRYAVFVIADVSGKGVSAAMYANITRVLLRDKEALQPTPKKMLSALNRSLEKEFHANHFLTMGYLVLDLERHTATYASAGHEPFLLVRKAESDIRFLKPSGYPFSRLHADLFRDRLREETCDLHPGDILFCYTDGLTDARNPDGDMFGEERLYRLLETARDLPSETLCQRIMDAVDEFAGSAGQHDDMTMIVIRYTALTQKEKETHVIKERA